MAAGREAAPRVASGWLRLTIIFAVTSFVETVRPIWALAAVTVTGALVPIMWLGRRTVEPRAAAA